MLRPSMIVIAAALATHAQPSPKTYAPVFDARRMVAGITNPYLPFTPGTELRYNGTGTSRGERTIVTVTNDRRTVNGVAAVVVHDQVFRDNVLVEDTYDWYAQDADGNVWYLGEDTKELKGGKVTSTEGSWEAGVNGAKPGIAMPGNPREVIGRTYRQEYFAGVAEDMGKVVAMHASARVPADTFKDCVETADWTPLEPKVRESKMYCRGVGLVRETEGPHGGSELYLVVRRNP